MKNLLVVSALLLMYGYSLPSVIAQPDSFLLQLTEQLESLSKDNDYFGLSIAVAREDQIVFEKAYGFADRNHNVPITTKTKFNIASIGKMLTAVAILQLEEQGKLKLDATVGTYFPDFPNSAIRTQVTIEQLLTHRSGLPLWFTPDFPIIPKYQYFDLKDYVPLMEQVRIDSAKVNTYQYSNVGYFVLGYLIEKIAGVPYGHHIYTTIGGPLDMLDLEFWAVDDIKWKSATGYMRPSKDGEAWRQNDRYNLASGPAGGAYTTPNSLLKFFLALQQHQLLSPENTARMMRTQVTTPQGGYGYGIGITSFNERPILGHLGGFFGARGELMWYRDAGYTVAILANSDQTDYIEVSHFVKTFLLGTTAQKNAYRKTSALINEVLARKHSMSEASAAALAGKGPYDESLIQIRAYFYLNENDFRKAINLFKMNYQLFQSPSTQNDLRKAAAKQQSYEAWKKW